MGPLHLVAVRAYLFLPPSSSPSSFVLPTPAIYARRPDLAKEGEETRGVEPPFVGCGRRNKDKKREKGMGGVWGGELGAYRGMELILNYTYIL